MAAKPPLLELRSQTGPRQDRPLRIESQLPHAISDAEDMLYACALVCSKCLPLQVLQCGRVLAPVASTGTMKEPRCVAMLSLQLLFKAILRVGFRC